MIELAVVLAIIGVLSSTAGAQYFKMLQRARVARAIVELRGIAAALDPMGDENATLPTSLAELGIETMDPWGRPYRYLKIQGNLPAGMASTGGGLPHVSAHPSTPSPPSAPGAEAGNAEGSGDGGGSSVMGEARKDRFLVPINSDYDLYSVGPDGETHVTLDFKTSCDDVIRAANGGFYGLAEKF